MAIKVVQNFLSSIRGALAVVMGQSTSNPDHAVAIQADEADGLLQVKVGGMKLPVAGAAPSTVAGTTGRLNQDVPLTINAGKTIVVHPKQNAVSVIGANGAAAAVSAVGKVVTLTAKNDGTTTVTAMLALIAASASVNALLGISGTGADTFVGTFTVAETPLWAAGTIQANVLVALGPDGYNWPAEMDSTGGIKTSASSLHYGEGDIVPQLRVQTARTFGTALVATGTGVAVPCRFWGVTVTGLTVGGSIGVRDGGAGGTLRFTKAIAADGDYPLGDGTFGTDVHITFVAPLAATVTPLYAPTT